MDIKYQADGSAVLSDVKVNKDGKAILTAAEVEELFEFNDSDGSLEKLRIYLNIIKKSAGGRVEKYAQLYLSSQ